MSEERRKRQQERDGGATVTARRRRFSFMPASLILLAGAFIAGRYYRNHKYDSFAQCLATKQAKMYGLYWCPHCVEQKEMFGAGVSLRAVRGVRDQGLPRKRRRNARPRG